MFNRMRRANNIRRFASHLQKRKSDVSPTKDSFELAEIERMHIIKVLQYTNGNKTETARLLKIGLATLYRKIEVYKINV